MKYETVASSYHFLCEKVFVNFCMYFRLDLNIFSLAVTQPTQL